MAFGEIPDYPPGSTFEDRHDLAASRVHRPIQSGICGSEQEGAESIVLSGGYVDDEDYGDLIIYTGQGGRDAATGRQSKNQHLRRGNLALANSLRHGLPVRVIRRAEQGGYRYDGLYRVDDYWKDTGVDGFLIWRYRLVALDLPTQDGRTAEPRDLFHAVPRQEGIVSRVIRDTAITRDIKDLYDYQCQICGTRLDTPAGPYAEAAHIQPLGAPHNGPDVIENVLCLCPNHHILFDRGQFVLSDELEVLGAPETLFVHPRHTIERAFIRYHREHFSPSSPDDDLRPGTK